MIRDINAEAIAAGLAKAAYQAAKKDGADNAVAYADAHAAYQEAMSSYRKRNPRKKSTASD